MTPSIASKVAVVIVTYNRPQYLQRLLESLVLSDLRPGAIIVLDNGSDAHADALVTQFTTQLSGCHLVYRRLDQNVGGSGGFHFGMESALSLGCDWLWLMDDDVEVVSNGLSGLVDWSKQFKCIQGRRYDFDGTPFSWQPIFSTRLGITLPYVGNPFKTKPYFLTNCGCFEGMFIHRSIVDAIGLPDSRFFITWDDAVYGWLASRVTEVAYVDHYVIRRSRIQRQISLVIRHLNDSNDVARFYVMRNRAYVELYLRHFGYYHPVLFRFGTFLTLCKEVVRLVAVERTLKGMASLLRGMKASQDLLRDEDWRPVLPLRKKSLKP
jgi:rhamnopyranosyl-N-acetylglucosaminyl-diphospho-decaprenol beta-1,3/1,4-galactofuranosyltransferase